ncbi:hypothetical protein [Saccharicrinis fermentans]|uniref:Uncharacterized protein n=1 Tax=Saccharicrinis fermentans DSM 9555 = JCM 21142 TaxID=869213 RepID=W7XW31_9BACT|nr:hypothetical protein [Saccharicrinis fermentans]GAF02480.1 hypothetical protein JCM21142_31116 [Saccharicrinis fermentans DSM 9555 = JCM 21142]
MTKFTLNPIEEIDGKQDIYKIQIDDECLFDNFEDEIEKRGQYEEELNSIYSLIEDVANNKLLPKTKFRDISISKKDTVKEYEFKSKHLRVYPIKASNGKIIIMGGYKNNQKKDIKKFRSIKSEYVKTLEK